MGRSWNFGRITEFVRSASLRRFASNTIWPLLSHSVGYVSAPRRNIRHRHRLISLYISRLLVFRVRTENPRVGGSIPLLGHHQSPGNTHGVQNSLRRIRLARQEYKILADARATPDYEFSLAHVSITALFRGKIHPCLKESLEHRRSVNAVRKARVHVDNIDFALLSGNRRLQCCNDL